MPELIIFSIGVIASLTGVTWVSRSVSGLAKRYGVPHSFVNTTLTSLFFSLPIVTVALISGVVRKEPTTVFGVLFGSLVILIGILPGFYFLISGKRPVLGYFSRSLNISSLLLILLLIISLSSPIGGLIGLLLAVLGVLFLFFEFKIAQRQNNIVYKFEEKIEKYISIFSFTKQNVLWVELSGGSLLILLGSFYIVDTLNSFSGLLKYNNFIVPWLILPSLLTLPLSTKVFNSLRHKQDLEISSLTGAAVLLLTFGLGTATILSPVNFSNGANLFIFGSLILLIGSCLFAVLKQFKLKISGALLLILSAISLAALLVFQGNIT